MEKSLFDLKKGHKGIIKKIPECHDCYKKLSSLNVRVGKKIQKVVNQPLNGPVVVKIDRSNIFMGKRIAMKILVEEEL